MNLQDQIRKIQQNPALVSQLMNSGDGQRLLQLLTSDGGAQLQRATSAAEGGNTADMVHMLAQLMKSDEGAKLVQQLNQKLQ